MIQTKAWDKLLSSYLLAGMVERVEPTKFDAWKAFNGIETKKVHYHVLRIGQKTKQSPNRIGKQLEKRTKKMRPPPKFSGLSAWQRTLRRVTEYDCLDSIRGRGGLLDDGGDDDDEPASAQSRAAAVTPTRGDGEESPAKRKKTSPSPDSFY